MPFIIRRSVVVDTESDVRDAQAAAAKYASFLRQNRDRIPLTLFRFFATDFFHDGQIETIDHTPGFHEVCFRIWCPNIQLKEASTTRFVNALFEVRFREVSRFVVDPEPEPAATAPLSFLGGEIETLVTDTQSLPHGQTAAKHSLIVETDSCWISFIFGAVEVEPVEPLAFELLCNDPRFSMPWAE